MLRRLWLLLSTAWAAVFIANGVTKLDGIGSGDVWLAAAPFIAGYLLTKGLRFVFTGSARRPHWRP